MSTDCKPRIFRDEHSYRRSLAGAASTIYVDGSSYGKTPPVTGNGPSEVLASPRLMGRIIDFRGDEAAGDGRTRGTEVHIGELWNSAG